MATQEYNFLNTILPGLKDKPYTREDKLVISLILRADSYKFSHPQAYRPGIKGLAAYIEARTRGEDIIVPFGLQMLLQKYFIQFTNMQFF